MTNEVRRDVVKLGLDFRPIPVDVGDGIEWEFHPDPSPEQWGVLVDSLKEFTKFEDKDFGGDTFEKALSAFTASMANLLISEDQQAAWIAKNYGLAAQQAISKALMELWTGFPTPPPAPSGKTSKPTG